MPPDRADQCDVVDPVVAPGIEIDDGMSRGHAEAGAVGLDIDQPRGVDGAAGLGREQGMDAVAGGLDANIVEIDVASRRLQDDIARLVDPSVADDAEAMIGIADAVAGIEMDEALLGLDLIVLRIEKDVVAGADGEVAVAAMEHMGAAEGVEEDVVAGLDIDGDEVVELIADEGLAHRAAADMVEAVRGRDGDVEGIDQEGAAGAGIYVAGEQHVMAADLDLAALDAA